MSAKLGFILVWGDQEGQSADVGTVRQITRNLSPMMRAAGLPPYRDLVGLSPAEALPHFEAAAAALAADPARFRALNPENGWGDYEGALEWAEGMARDCRVVHPEARIWGSL